jgi:hypothetical protein
MGSVMGCRLIWRLILGSEVDAEMHGLALGEIELENGNMIPFLRVTIKGGFQL